MDTNITKVPQRKIGKDNVSALGLGCMGMSAFYTSNLKPEELEKQSLEVLTRAADLGITHWDTSDVYGPFTNEELLGKWFKQTGRRNEIFLATKFAVSINPETKERKTRGDKAYVRQCIDGSLKRLGVDYVDLYYIHRVDYNTRIEETVEELAELVKEGKVKHIGISECSEKTLRRAHKVHPISAIQVEYSLFCLDIEREEFGLRKACDELNIAIVAYSPLGRGLLTGQLKSRADLAQGDTRLNFPRFSEENFHHNLTLVDKVNEIAKRKGCTSGQLSLAWVLKQGDNVLPIPGTKNLKYLEENTGALNVEITSEEEKELRELAEKAEVKGERYPPQLYSGCYYDKDTI